MSSPSHNDRNQILWSITKLTIIVVVLFAFFGLVLTVVGSQGYIEFSITKFISNNVFLGAIGIGAISMVLILRKIIASIIKPPYPESKEPSPTKEPEKKYILDIISKNEPSKGRPGEWPPKIFETVIELLHNHEMSSLDIASALGISEKMAENILLNMERRGLVERKGNVFTVLK